MTYELSIDAQLPTMHVVHAIRETIIHPMQEKNGKDLYVTCSIA